jgi:hypothetical protein
MTVELVTLNMIACISETREIKSLESLNAIAIQLNKTKLQSCLTNILNIFIPLNGE